MGTKQKLWLILGLILMLAGLLASYNERPGKARKAGPAPARQDAPFQASKPAGNTAAPDESNYFK